MSLRATAMPTHSRRRPGVYDRLPARAPTPLPHPCLSTLPPLRQLPGNAAGVPHIIPMSRMTRRTSPQFPAQKQMRGFSGFPRPNVLEWGDPACVRSSRRHMPSLALDPLSTNSATAWPTHASVDNTNIASRQHVPCLYAILSLELGTGTYSTVMEGKNLRTGCHYALKRVPKLRVVGREGMLQNEVSVLQRVLRGHKNVLTLVDYFETDDGLYLVTDLAGGGDLFDRIVNSGHFYELDAANIVRLVALALAFLHANHIVHRDVKAENILFQTGKSDSDLLLGDFGLAARVADSQELHLMCGTRLYMAPELVGRAGYGAPVDMWALGVVCYFVLCGYMPFDCETDEETTTAISSADYSFEPASYWEHVETPARDFIARLFVLDPGARMSADQALTHLFLAASDKLRALRFNLLPGVRSNLMARGGRSPMLSPGHSPRMTPLGARSPLGALSPRVPNSRRRMLAIEVSRRVPTAADLMHGALCLSPELVDGPMLTVASVLVLQVPLRALSPVPGLSRLLSSYENVLDALVLHTLDAALVAKKLTALAARSGEVPI